MVAKLVRVPEDAIDIGRSATDHGVDSLAFLELRERMNGLCLFVSLMKSG